MTLEELMARVDALEKDLTPLIKEVLTKVHTIEGQNQTQLEMMEAWNNTKGFVKTVVILGKVAKFIAVTGGAVATVWAAIKYGVNGRN